MEILLERARSWLGWKGFKIDGIVWKLALIRQCSRGGSP